MEQDTQHSLEAVFYRLLFEEEIPEDNTTAGRAWALGCYYGYSNARREIEKATGTQLHLLEYARNLKPEHSREEG